MFFQLVVPELVTHFYIVILYKRVTTTSWTASIKTRGFGLNVNCSDDDPILVF